MAHNSGRFHFDGGAGTYLGTGILAALITICTAGICYPFALVLLERWRCKHTYVDGQRLVFSGTGIGVFGLWIKWFLLKGVSILIPPDPTSRRRTSSTPRQFGSSHVQAGR